MRSTRLYQSGRLDWDSGKISMNSSLQEISQPRRDFHPTDRSNLTVQYSINVLLEMIQVLRGHEHSLPHLCHKDGAYPPEVL